MRYTGTCKCKVKSPAFHLVLLFMQHGSRTVLDIAPGGAQIEILRGLTGFLLILEPKRVLIEPVTVPIPRRI